MIEHDQATRLLPAFAAGELAPEERRPLEAHLAECESCREWLATYEFLGTALRDESVESHPDSDLVAAFVVHPGALERETRSEIESHLEGCDSCKRESRLLGEALEGARDATSKRSRSSWVPLRWAAGLGALLLGAAWILAPEPGSTPAPEFSAADLAAQENLISGRSIHESGSFEAPLRLIAERSRIEGGATAVFRAGEVVSFGEGFQVGADSELTVEITPINKSAS